jgi:hypothetical protein
MVTEKKGVLGGYARDNWQLNLKELPFFISKKVITIN